MAQHRDLPVALRREPIKLNHAALAGKRLVPVPRIVAALERHKRAGGRRHLNNDIVEIGSRAKKP